MLHFRPPPLTIIRSALNQRRWLNLQEYQSKELLKKHGVAIQKFEVISRHDEVPQALKKLRSFDVIYFCNLKPLNVVDVPEVVVKAQILAGGRGKGTFSNGMKGGVFVMPWFESC